MAKQTILLDEDKITAIKKASTGGVMRKVYDSIDEAKAAFEKGKTLAEKEGLPVVSVDESKFDGMQAAVAVVGARKRNSKGTMDSGIRALVLFPVPTAEQFIESARDWVAKIAEKEAAHVAFRNLRNAESDDELIQAVDKMPVTVEEYVASHRGGEGIDTETFDAIWSDARKFLKEKMPALADLLPQKGEALKALRSKEYAESDPQLAPLEERGVFAFLGKFLIQVAEAWQDDKGEPAPLDTTAIQEWLDNRDTLILPKRAPAEKDFSVLENLDESKLAAML